MYNLTDNQKEAIRWIVQKVREGKLPEEFSFLTLGSGDIRFVGKGIRDVTEHPQITEGILNALMASGLLIVTKGERFLIHCTLLGKAYSSVDSNFTYDNPDNKSMVKHSYANRAIAIALLILGVGIALTANVATATLPKFLEPYLWLSWFFLVILIIVSSILYLKQ